MTFISANINQSVPGIGPRDAKIILVGEAPGAEEARQGKPFVGPAGTVLEQCLHAAGLTRSECYITNVVKQRPANNDISPYFKAGTQGRHSWTTAGTEAVNNLHEELAALKPNVVVALGAVAQAALTGSSQILKYRGYIMEGHNGLKVIPTIHPAASLRGQYIYRYIISYDLRKARAESEYPDIRRPERHLVYSFSNANEVIEWINQCGRCSRLSVDIEVLNYELAIIGLSSSPTLGIAIPMASPEWSIDEEVMIWRAMAAVLENPNITKVMQNGIFDIHFLASKCGIHIKGPIEDTMMAHSLTYPDLRKGLDFLGSLYCGSQAYWKDMIKWDNIKEDS
jgi:uracil-DNA glycosylase